MTRTVTAVDDETVISTQIQYWFLPLVPTLLTFLIALHILHKRNTESISFHVENLSQKQL